MDRRGSKPFTRITNQQLSRLISLMENEPAIANNAVRGPQTAFWKKVAKDLNDHGPVIRDTSSWKRVWFDYKCSVKKRVRQQNDDIAAGNYPRVLSVMHKRVVKLLNIETKKVKLPEDMASGSEDMPSVQANGFKNNTFDAEDSNTLASMLQDASDDNIPLAKQTSSREINNCQKRLEKLPNITITKQRHDKDPLANGTNNYSADEESNPPFGKWRKSVRDAKFRKALETNKEMIVAMNASLTVSHELTAQLRATKKSCDELNENMKNVNSTLRELIEVLKKK
uniref:Regulatory protein zeste n=1 Tax=Anopheles funestus TaxID=62324 RepID=A0A182R6R4_ANOFN